MKIKVIVLAVAVLAMAGAADAATSFTWDGGGVDNLWTTGENWVDDVAPNGSVYKIYIKNGTAQMDSGTSVTASSHLYLAYDGDACLTVNGGSLTMGGYGILGYNSADTGTLNVYGGEVSFNGSIGLGIGWKGKGYATVDGGTLNANYIYTSRDAACPGGSSLTMHSGTINVTNYVSTSQIYASPSSTMQSDTITIDGGVLNVGTHFTLAFFGETALNLSGTGEINIEEELLLGDKSTSSGIINMTGGAINCGDFIVGDVYDTETETEGGSGYVDLLGGIITAETLAVNAHGFLNIAGGTLVLNGQITDITAFGNAAAYNGMGSFIYDYDSTEDVTVITAVIPEPATIILLGFGGFIIRRKNNI